MEPSGETERVRAGGDNIVALFRRAMRQLGGAVCLITARDSQGGPHGMAASAVISVSMEPASLLVSIKRTASLYPIVSSSGLFCANVVDDSARPLVAMFARSERRNERFLSGEWRRGWHGLPYLASALCSVFCAVDAGLEYGTHTLFVGRVRHVSLTEGGLPLLWIAGGFATPKLVCHQ